MLPRIPDVVMPWALVIAMGHSSGATMRSSRASVRSPFRLTRGARIWSVVQSKAPSNMGVIARRASVGVTSMKTLSVPTQAQRFAGLILLVTLPVPFER